MFPCTYPTSVFRDPMEVPKGPSSMLDSPLRKKVSGRTSAPSSPFRTSRPSSPLKMPSPIRPGLVVQPSGSVILLPDLSTPVPDTGAGITSEGTVAPELEVHHARVDMSAPENTDLGISHTDADQTKAKTLEKPEQEKEAPPLPKPATPPPKTASPSPKPATSPPKQTTPQAEPGGKKLTASDIGLQKRPRPSSSETSPAKKRLAKSSSA